MEHEDQQQEHGSLLAYYECLRDNKHFRMLWLAETIDNIGSWLNYVAVLTLVEVSGSGQQAHETSASPRHLWQT